MVRGQDDHEQFQELSALANTGTLGSAELAELYSHLQFCQRCRDVHLQYRFLARVGMPRLASAPYDVNEKRGGDLIAVREKLFARIHKEERISGNRWFQLSAPQSWLKLGNLYTTAASVTFAVSLLLLLAGAYHLGARMQSGAKSMVTSQSSIEPLAAEKKLTLDRVQMQADQILHLQEEKSGNQQEIARVKLALHTMTEKLNTTSAAKDRTDQEAQELASQRDILSNQLRELEQTNENIKAELASLRAERDKALLHMASLESKVDELTAESRDRERRIKDDEQYLASDRDIRELMGARGLYIADVYDVDSHSRTRKSYGRIFYTQGKSLIFYAFDLDLGVKNANAFQVWGRKEMARGADPRPRNLGILYLDSESNHRWVMRFDDAKQLEEIDAVFVTVEPNGGSPKPTSKPFLYALLRKEANHP